MITKQLEISKQMTVLPSGSIQLRDDRIITSWSVQIESFQPAKFPLTQEIYESVLGSNPSMFKSLKNPVENVSWLKAVKFCYTASELLGLKPCYAINSEGADRIKISNGFRLPTEAEWEFACRAGSQTPRCGPIDDIAWYAENSKGTTHAVGLKQPNAWGLYDMLGNIWEWTQDLYNEKVYGSYRVFRGGDWNDQRRGCLASNRRPSYPTFAIDDLGFRLACSI